MLWSLILAVPSNLGHRAHARPRNHRCDARRGFSTCSPCYEVSGEAGLRARLSTLTVDQLKDTIAEQGMNHDGAAMRWKATPRLVNRIVERVQARSTIGEVLR